MMMIATGSPNAACGRATPSGLLSNPICRNVRKSGRIATATGNSRPRPNSPYTTSRPRNAKRAMTKAAIDDTGTTMPAVSRAITALLRTWRQNAGDVRIDV